MRAPIRAKDIVGTLGTALVTAAVVVILLRPSPGGAENDNAGLTKTIPVPTLNLSGVEWTLTRADAAKNESVEGETLAFLLTARNTTGDSVQSAVEMRMTAMKPPARMSRTVPASREFWRGQGSLTLGPGETKSFVHTAEAPLPGDSQIRVLMAAPVTGNDTAAGIVPGRQIVALTLSTVKSASR